MARQVDHVVIFPRGTALIEGAELYSEAMDVRNYTEAGFIARQEGASPRMPVCVQYTVQQSPDGQNWVAGAPFSPGFAATAVESEVPFAYRWMRVKAERSSWEAGALCWLEAEFARKEQATADGGA